MFNSSPSARPSASVSGLPGSSPRSPSSASARLSASRSPSIATAVSVATVSTASTGAVSATGSGALSVTGAGAGSASGARTALMPSLATPAVSVPGAIETLDVPGRPDPGVERMAGPGGSAPSGGVRFAPSGTFGAGVVSAGASDAGAPSSADADSVWAETVPIQSDAANAAPAAIATARVDFILYLPSGSPGEPVSLMRGNRVVHRYTGRPAADSTPVYEADGMEVSRTGNLADLLLAQSGSTR